MKKVIAFSFFFFFLAIACKKEPIVPIYFPGDQEFGQASALKNNKAWEASVFAVEEDWSVGTVSILMETFSEGGSGQGSLREILGFNEVPVKTGIHEIGNNNDLNDGLVGVSYGTSEASGDVGEDFYIMDETAPDNRIEVTFLDTVEMRIEGIFTVSFDIQDPEKKLNPLNPDRVKFSNGTFSVGYYP